MSKVLLRDISLNHGEYGIPAPAMTYIEGNYRYLRISDITEDGCLDNTDIKGVEGENLEQYLLKENDIVFARTGNSTGRAYFYEKKDGDLIYAGFLIKYSLDERVINPKYMKYFTISKEYKKWIQNTSVGSTRGGINAKTLLNLPITIPSRKQQDELVSILSTFDNQIELNNKINQELEEMAQTLYNYWFVQFEFPNEEGNPYKSSGGKMIWNEELKREIPVGWEVKRLEDLVKIKSGYAFNSKDYDENGNYKLITIKNVQDGYVDTHTDNRISIISDSVPEYCKLSVGDILISLTGNVARVGLVSEENLLLNQRVGLLEPQKDFLRGYVYALFRNDNMKNKLQRLATGTSQKNLSPIQVGEEVIILPKEELLKEYSLIANGLLDAILNNNQQNQELIKLRDYMLPLLMSGQVTIED